MKALLDRVKSSLSLQIVVGIVAGILLGPVLGASAKPFGEIGRTLIQLIKAIAAPLIFFAVLEALLRSEVRVRHGLQMTAVAFINAGLSCLIALGICNWLKPGLLFAEHFPMQSLIAEGSGEATSKALNYTPQAIDVSKAFSGFFPTSVVGALAENNLVQIVIIALFSGAAVVSLRKKYGHSGVDSDTHQILGRVRGPEGTHLEPAHMEAEIEARSIRKAVDSFSDLVSLGLRISEKTLSWILKLVPIAIFGIIARTTGEHGYGVFGGLGVYFFVVLGALLIHVIFVYQAWIVFVSKVGLARFWREAIGPIIYAAGSNSSLATFPLTLKALDRLGVSKASARLGACVGTNLNNDGILLYEVLAALFIAQAFGVEMSLGQQVVAALLCVVAALGVAGVPEAGIISLSIVLTTLKLPLEILPVLMTVDWILGRVRSMVNVVSDMVVSASIDRFR